jgi:hypothetical protein
MTIHDNTELDTQLVNLERRQLDHVQFFLRGKQARQKRAHGKVRNNDDIRLVEHFGLWQGEGEAMRILPGAQQVLCFAVPCEDLIHIRL